jgi:class 3 adenylate cyclase
MGWEYDRSRERIRRHLDAMGEIEVAKLGRLADLESLLTETTCREIYGAHVYAKVTNFAQLASCASDEDDTYKRLIQALHLYQREVSRIVEQVFDGLRVHFQGATLHALFYRPVDDGAALATRAVLLQFVLKDFIRTIFNPAFPHFENFAVAAGVDLGTAIGTRNGMDGDRELLFLGSPANYAAKIISRSGRLRLTQRVCEALPRVLQDLCSAVEDGPFDDVYQLAFVSSADLDTLLGEAGITWDREACCERIALDKRSFALTDLSYSSANTLIDLDTLSIRNTKRVLAASLFADVAGFTAYIEQAEDTGAEAEALRVFHSVRKEMAHVIRSDYEGLRVQFQGDRAQGFYHMPKDDEAAIVAEAIGAAVGLQSSMEHSLKDCLPAARDLRLAIGVDLGTTLVSKLGTRAHRDRICLGEPVEHAAACEERSAGGEIGVSKVVYDLLSDDLRGHFAWNAAAQYYVAAGLSADKVERATRGALMYRSGAAVYLSRSAQGVTVSSQEVSNARPITPSRPYAPDHRAGE